MFVKLFASILDSSVWAEDCETRVVWITMLAMADEYGVVHAAVPGLAYRARVGIETCERALTILSGPDKYDRSGVKDGRRIEPLHGGWQVVNYGKHRELRSRKDVVNGMRQQRYRDRNALRSDVTSNATPQRVTDNVTRNAVTTEAEAEAERKKDSGQRKKNERNAPPERAQEAAPLRSASLGAARLPSPPQHIGAVLADLETVLEAGKPVS